MNMQPQFPPHRRQNPRRNSEAVVYDQLARNHHPGQALYEYVTSAHAGGRDPHRGCLQPDPTARLRRPVEGGHRARRRQP